MLARICDFCGNTILNDDFYGKISYAYPYTMNSGTEIKAKNKAATSGDMCSTCCNKIDTYITNLRKSKKEIKV